MMTLLIVDDDRTNRLRLAQMSRSLGHFALSASDGSRALAMLEDNPGIDMVITDWQMPVMDGPALIRALREAGNPVPVLAYSAYRSINEVAGLLKLGADYFLAYPVSRGELSEYLERFRIQPKAGARETAFSPERPTWPFSPG
jgi:sigma-B regulation protein RsbU (phosphoserine phosphatase)